MDEPNNLSAFEAYQKSKKNGKDKMKAKKKLKLINAEATKKAPKESTPLPKPNQGDVSSEDPMWKNFVTDFKNNPWKKSKKRKKFLDHEQSTELNFSKISDRKRIKLNKKSDETVNGNSYFDEVPFDSEENDVGEHNVMQETVILQKKERHNVESAERKKATKIKFKDTGNKERSPNLKVKADNREVVKQSIQKTNANLTSSSEITSTFTDSVEEGKTMLAWILSPIDVDQFFRDYWEQKPLYISRDSEDYFSGIFSTKDLDRALRCFPIYFGKNIDVTSYKNGVRSTHNPAGRARAGTVWDYFRDGHSIRLLNPQTFVPNVGKIVNALQEFFKCMVGVNSYLTPAGTQGFAPHYDDIEAFVLQLEGEKLWKVYAPRNEAETLPRFSSPNFSQEEIGEPILEVCLRPGDLLYFPRGFIHQAKSVESQHSFHLTVSTYQRNTWSDFFEKAIPAALELAREEIPELRAGLPLNFLQCLGVVNADSNLSQRETILKNANKLFEKLLDFCPWDAAADQIGKQFIHDSLPIPTSANTDLLNLDIVFKKPRKKLSVKLVTANCLRLVMEGESLFVYYNTDNSKTYHEEDAQCFEITSSAAPALESLIRSYPRFSGLQDLPQEEGWLPVGELLTELGARNLLLYDGRMPAIPSSVPFSA